MKTMRAVAASAVELECRACGEHVRLSTTPRDLARAWMGSHREPTVVAVRVVVPGVGFQWWKRID